MYGYQPPAARRLAQTPEQYADGGLVARMKSADAGPAAFGSRGLSQLRDMVPQMAAMGYPQQAAAPAPAPAPVSDPRVAQLQAMIPKMEAMGFQKRPLTPQMLARGGMVRGPGTGTSDSIPDEAEPGTYIMPADSTAAIGPSALEKMGTVSVRLSDGEFKMPPEQVMAIGEAVLKLMKDATHTPVNGEDGGQTDAEVDDDDGARGFNPADRMAQMPQMFADGGMVDPNRPNSFGDAAAVTRDPGVTQVDSGYQPGNGTVSVLPSQPISAPASAPAPTPTAAAAPTPSAPAAAPAATPAPPAPMGWAERNAQRNLQVTASSIMDSPERRAAQAALAPPPPPAPVAPPPAAPAPITSGFQSASQRLGTLSSVGQPRAGYQPRRYADGGMVGDDERAVFGFYPQLAGGNRTTYATDQKLRSGVVATGPNAFEPAVNPAPPAPSPVVGGGDGRRMNATQDPRSLAFAGSTEAPASSPASSGSLSRAAALMGAMPSTAPAPVSGAPVSAQNMRAADSLARRGAADALADMPNAPAPVQAPTVRHSGNDWAARNALRNAEVSASSIMNNGGKWDQTGGRNPAALAYRAALDTDNALQATEPALGLAAMKDASENNRAAMRERGLAAQAMASERGAMDRTLITERGNNTRAGINALAGLEEARLKAGSTGTKLTEDQAKSAGYALRMDNALKLINEIGAKNPGATRPGVGTSLLNALPEGVANYIRPEDRQRVEAAQLDALDAALTLNTGAAYTREQLQGLSRSYFPQPGDDPKTVAEKQARLASQVETARLRAGPGGSAMADAAQARGAQPAAQPGAGGPVPEDVGALLKKYGG